MGQFARCSPRVIQRQTRYLVLKGTEKKFYVEKTRRNKVKAIRMTYYAMRVA